VFVYHFPRRSAFAKVRAAGLLMLFLSAAAIF